MACSSILECKSFLCDSQPMCDAFSDIRQELIRRCKNRKAFNRLMTMKTVRQLVKQWRKDAEYLTDERMTGPADKLRDRKQRAEAYERCANQLEGALNEIKDKICQSE